MKKGFTLIELLVVIGVSVVLSAIAISYSKIGQNQITLSVEEAKISQFILQAKELSIATYTGGSASCGFGMYFNVPAQRYSLFSYNPAGAPPCPKMNAITSIGPADIGQYTPGTWNVAVSRGVKMTLSPGGANDSIAYVLFYPPAPTTFFIDNGASDIVQQTSHVYLSTTDNSASAVVTVNPAGQVSL
jgi:prepilin-type N-terminal cleavage/methylation domain-containing protein